jgi:hypothetical protein
MKTGAEKPDAAKGPDALFYFWYANARTWDCMLGWVPGYGEGSGAKQDLRVRRLYKAGKGDPSVVQSLIKMKGYEQCPNE